MSELAQVLRFIPSFAARVADAVIAAAPNKSMGRFRRFLQERLYLAAHAFFSGHERAPMDVMVGAALRQKKIATTADLVEAMVAAIDPRALDGHRRSARIAQIAAFEMDATFAINTTFAVSLYLLEKKAWSVMIANTFDIPVPFGVVLAEELDQVGQSRAAREHITAQQHA